MNRTSKSIAIINTHLNTNGCALSSREVFLSAPLFLITENTEFCVSVPPTFQKKNKGALLEIHELLRAQQLVRRRMSVIATLFERLHNPLFTQE
jgi:hypothetical protein